MNTRFTTPQIVIKNMKNKDLSPEKIIDDLIGGGFSDTEASCMLVRALGELIFTDKDLNNIEYIKNIIAYLYNQWGCA